MIQALGSGSVTEWYTNQELTDQLWIVKDSWPSGNTLFLFLDRDH
jgi:hypothetical protein